MASPWQDQRRNNQWESPRQKQWEPQRQGQWEPQRPNVWEPQRQNEWEPQRQGQWEPQRQNEWEPQTERQMGRARQNQPDSQNGDRWAVQDPEQLARRDPEEFPLRTTESSIDELKKEFKPMFDSYGPEGVPIKELKEELKDHLSSDRLNEILRKFDTNQDKYLTYDEFIVMMMSDGAAINRHEKSLMKSFVATAIQNIVPKGDQKDFLQTYSCCPPPIFMIVITLAEVIVFGVYAALLADDGIPITATSGVSLSSPLIYNPKRRYEAWRFVTYMFLHQGYLHLIGNMIVQLLLGLPLELAHKWWRVILIYVLGVLAGSMAHSITDTNSLLVGASGGCYALIGGHIASTIINWKEMNYQCCSGSIKRLLLSAPVRLAACLIYVCVDTGVAVYRRFFSDNPAKIGISAHMGGLVAGLVLGVLILRNIHKLSWELILGWVSLAIYLVFIIVVTLFNIFYPHYPEVDWRPCCPSPHLGS